MAQDEPDVSVSPHAGPEATSDAPDLGERFQTQLLAAHLDGFSKRALAALETVSDSLTEEIAAKSMQIAKDDGMSVVDTPHVERAAEQIRKISNAPTETGPYLLALGTLIMGAVLSTIASLLLPPSHPAVWWTAVVLGGVAATALLVVGSPWWQRSRSLRKRKAR